LYQARPLLQVTKLAVIQLQVWMDAAFDLIICSGWYFNIIIPILAYYLIKHGNRCCREKRETSFPESEAITTFTFLQRWF